MSAITRKQAWLLLATTITIQLIVSRSSRSLKSNTLHSTLNILQKRNSSPNDIPAPHTSRLSLPYSTYYTSLPPTLRPFALTLFLLLLTFLFSFIGITASDFFCPNLSTIASVLGLNESTAGVTFLAFGNGSPDVFSTFAALRGGTFGLAVGELIGAASFIVSIVVGSIALIRPFHVPRHAFLRDVLFFTLAVIVLITVLHDGHLILIESMAMVALYIAYVIVVVAGNWLGRRRRRKAELKALRDEALEGEGRRASVPSIQLPSPGLAVEDSPVAGTTVVRGRLSPTASPLALSPNASPRLRARRHLLTQHGDEPYTDTPRANFSLLGAIEFRDVVNSLRKEGSPSRGISRSTTPMGTGHAAPHGGDDYFGPGVQQMYAGHRRSSSHFDFRRADSQAGGNLSAGVGGSNTPKGRQRASTHHSHLPGPDFGRLTEISPELPSGENSQSSPQDLNPWEDQPGNPMTPSIPQSHLSPSKPPRPRVIIPRKSTNPQHRSIPSISITDPTGSAAPPPLLTTPSHSTDGFHSPNASRESRFQIRRHLRLILRVLFPSLQSFRHKSYVGMVLALLSVPAILALTVTLPVVDDGRGDEGGIELPVGEDEPLSGTGRDLEAGAEGGVEDADEDRLLSADVGEELHHLVDGGFSPLHSPLGRIHQHHLHHHHHQHPHLQHQHSHALLRTVTEGSGSAGEEGTLVNGNGIGDGVLKGEDVDSEDREVEEESLEFNRWLTGVQCVMGPMFCALVIFQEVDALPWILLGVGLTGLVAGVVVVGTATEGLGQPWRIIRCFAGFVCSMVWIAAIADEVVSVLQAVGEIMGLSDAIIGLTIFAVGNSLADLVANVTVAQFAPAMAYAACFGGPMLNLLLGIGGSGTYHMLTSPTTSPVLVHFSPTLWTSAIGLVIVLVATAIFVPLNGYLIDRKWACCLILAYVILMIVNVVVEIKTGRET